MAVDRFQAFRNDEGRYRLLVDAIFDYAIYLLDPSGQVSSWNPGARRFKGYEASEIIGEHFSRFYTPEDRAAGVPEQALRKASQEGRFESEGWRVRKDGSRFWAHVIIDPVRTPTGELAGFAKVIRDLTERKQAEERIRQSEEQFRILVQGVTDYAIYMLDPQGRVSSWNAGAQRIKGYQAHEIIGHHFSRFYTEEDRAAGAPALALQSAIREGRFEREGRRVRKDGAQFWAHVVIDPIRNDAGEIIGFAKITRDITERVETQRSLTEAREALLQTQKLEAIGQLTGGVAHDFNNLLMAVLGSLELLRKHMPRDNAKATALLENAVQGAERGAALTKRMLAFARKQELKLEPVDVGALVRGLAGLIQRSVGQRVILDLAFERGLPQVLTDPNQLETALLNLAVNARDAMPDGGRILIEGRLRSLSAPQGELAAGDYVVVGVIDAGFGMDAETVARAAEPFFTTKGVGKGTGLGLSMVHGLAAQSGGRIEITSRPGEGTRIGLWLPATASPASRSPRGLDLQPELDRKLSVLIVDDDGLVLMNAAAMLEDLGHVAVAASSAGEALSAARDRAFDLVVTDYAMPQMTGLELARALKTFCPELPVILTSGYAELPQDSGHEVRRLAKPYTQLELSRALAEAIATGARIEV